MKKPTGELWERQFRLALYRAADRLRAKGQSGRSHLRCRYVVPGEVIRAPKKFDLVQGPALEVAKFLRAVATAVLVRGLRVRLDFRFTETFYPGATVLLFAELDRIVSLAAVPKPVTIMNPRFRRPREVLKQIGIHELTGDRCDIIPERQDVVYWKATKGFDQSGHQLEMLEAVADRVNRVHAESLELSGVWRGVSEAVANSVEHAYKRARADGFAGLADTRWWMFTQLRDAVFTIAVCDLGCGYRATINETIPEQFVARVLAELGNWNRDSRAVWTAMEYGRSSTRKMERGKGSRDAISVLEKHGDGDLMIMSNAGWLRFMYQGGVQTKVEHGSLGIDVRGTIIWWRLPLKEA